MQIRGRERGVSIYRYTQRRREKVMASMWCCTLLLKRCFTSTETAGLLGTGAQDSHLDFHTAPELWEMVGWLKCCFTSTETVGLLGTGAQDGHLDFHTVPELCCTLQRVFVTWNSQRLWRAEVEARKGCINFHHMNEPGIKTSRCWRHVLPLHGGQGQFSHCKINKQGNSLVLEKRHTHTRTKSWVAYRNSHLACE